MAYGIRYQLLYKDVLNRSARLDIAKNNYTGAVTELKGSDNPFVVTYSGENDYKFAAIVGSEAEIGLNASSSFSLVDLYSSDEREYLISHYTNNVLDYRGFLIPDDASEPYIHYPYAIKLRATDLLGTLKGIPYLDSNGAVYRNKQTFLQVIVNCLSKTGLDLPISTCVNTYEESMATGLSNDPLTQAKIDPARYRDANGTPFSCYDVLKAVLNQFTASVRQVNGRFDITDITEFAKPSQRRRYYTSAGVFQAAAEETSLRLAPDGESTKLIESDHTVRIDKPFRMVEVYYEYGFYTSILLNGDFLNFANNTFDNWTNNGGLIVSSVSPSNSFGAKINEAFNPAKYLKSAPVSVGQSDTLTLSGNFTTYHGNTAKVKIVIAGYSLKQDGTWSTSDNYLDVRPPGSDRRIPGPESGKFEITTSPVPVSGNVHIQLYGTIKWSNPAATQDISYYGLNVNKSTGSRANKIPKGEVFSVEQAGNYSFIPDKVLLLHGDLIDGSLLDTANLRPSRGNFVTPTDTKTSNIYRLDETTITSKWNRFGKTDNKPLGLIAAKNIINNYQRPLRFFEGSFKGIGLNPLQVFSISGLTGKFIVLSGSFDYKNVSANLVLAEVVNEEVAVSERIYSDFGAIESGKSGISSPGGVSSSGGGIVGGVSGPATLQEVTEQGATTDKIITAAGLIAENRLSIPHDLGANYKVNFKFSQNGGSGGSAPPPPITDLSNYYNKTEVNNLIAGIHTHSNKAVLDGITSTLVTNWNTAFSNNHSHGNKAVIDGITSTLVTNWNAAFGWGNHASQAYLKSITSALVTGALGYTPYNPASYPVNLNGETLQSITDRGATTTTGIKIANGNTTVARLTLRSAVNTDGVKLIDINNDSDVFRMGIEYNNAVPALSLVDRNKTKLLTVLETGNIGIGTSIADHKLHVVSPDFNLFKLQRTGANAGAFTIQGYGNTFNFSTIDYANMFSLSNGNIGIGTTSPLSKLHVQDGTGHERITIGNVTGGSGGFIFTSDTMSRILMTANLYDHPVTAWTKQVASIGYSGFDANATNVYGIARLIAGNPTDPAYSANAIAIEAYRSTTDNYIKFNTGGAERLRIDNGGSVGIGTANPTQTLHVRGNILAQNPGTAPNGSDISLGSPSGFIGVVMQYGNGSGGGLRRWDTYIHSDLSYRIKDGTANADRLTINSNGNVVVQSSLEVMQALYIPHNLGTSYKVRLKFVG